MESSGWNLLPSAEDLRIVLSIDMRLQAAAERAFPGTAGAVVAMDVRSGFILAMVSRPGRSVGPVVVPIAQNFVQGQQRDLPAAVELGDVLRIGSVALLLCALATIYPAWRAARVAPAEALRHD